MKRLVLPVIVVLMLVGCGGKQAPDIDLWTAAGSGNISAIEQHVEYGSNLNAKEPTGGGTPLIVAALFGQMDAAKLLIDNGASLEIKNNDGATALHVAAFFGQPQVVSLLLEQGADSTAKNNSGQTPLEVVADEWTQELEQLYLFFGGALQTELNLEQIKVARPEIANILRQHGSE
jgi:hypothetical protein